MKIIRNALKQNAMLQWRMKYTNTKVFRFAAFGKTLKPEIQSFSRTVKQSDRNF